MSLEALNNTLEYLRGRGFTNEASASWYVQTKYWLGLPIPNPQEIIDYLDSRQWLDGGWGYLPYSGSEGGGRWYMARLPLISYVMLNTRPRLPLTDFLSPLEDWDVVYRYATNHEEPWSDYSRYGEFSDVYHLIFCYAIGNKRLPWWVRDDSPLWNDYLERDQQVIDTWTLGDTHRRSHIGFSYILPQRPLPNALSMVQQMYETQDENGSWGGNGTLNLWTMGALKCLNPEVKPYISYIDEMMHKHAQFISSLYIERIVDGTPYGYLNWGGVKLPSEWTSWEDEANFWMSFNHKAAGAVMSGFLPGNMDPCFHEVLSLLGTSPLALLSIPAGIALVFFGSYVL